jgi:hypothetical protein
MCCGGGENKMLISLDLSGEFIVQQEIEFISSESYFHKKSIRGQF